MTNETPPIGPDEDQKPTLPGRRAPRRAADLTGIERTPRPSSSPSSRPGSTPLEGPSSPAKAAGAPAPSTPSKPARKSLLERARGAAATAVAAQGGAVSSTSSVAPGASTASKLGASKPGVAPGTPSPAGATGSSAPPSAPGALGSKSSSEKNDALRKAAKKDPTLKKNGAPKGKVAQARDAKIEQAKLAASAAIAGVTGVPPQVVKKVLDKWKILMALVMVCSMLPVIIVFAVVSIAIDGAVNSGGAGACTTTSGTPSSVTSTGPAAPPPANELSLFMAAERWAESRNKYVDVTAGGTWDPNYTGDQNLHGHYGAFGAYQYLQTTWYPYAVDAGEGAYSNTNPNTLPASVSAKVQDAIATWEFTRNYKDDSHNPSDTGNVWFWVAEQHFGSSNPIALAAYGNEVVGYMTSTPWLATAGGAAANTAIEVATGQCGATEISGPLASKILQVAQAELGKTQAQEPTADAWGPPNNGEWCAYFASWVYDQAGVKPAPGSIGPVSGLWAWGGSGGGVQLAATATPQPGDLVMFGTGTTFEEMKHVAIVASVLANGEITVIGGNQGGSSSGSATVSVSLPFAPATAYAIGWPAPIYGYVQPPGA